MTEATSNYARPKASPTPNTFIQRLKKSQVSTIMLRRLSIPLSMTLKLSPTSVAKASTKNSLPTSASRLCSAAANVPQPTPNPMTKQIPEPTREQLRIVALHQAIPFVGFGVMDNSILLLAGEAIDTTLGVYLGLSTLCAAAIGNIISDICGVAFGTIKEYTIRTRSHKI